MYKKHKIMKAHNKFTIKIKNVKTENIKINTNVKYE